MNHHGNVREFHVVWRVVTLQCSVCCVNKAQHLIPSSIKCGSVQLGHSLYL